jgi:hypothetical protein
MHSSKVSKASAFCCETNTYFCPAFDFLKHFMMKKLLFLLPVLAFVMAACSNEFEVAAPWKEIPVAYAILSPKDSAHYIRIEKAFLDPETSAFEIAQIADSLYYPEDAIAVYLQRISTGDRYQLYRVDGALEGYPRKDGIFATQPNWLYKIKPSELDSLRKGETFQLVITRADGKPDVTAETTIPKDFIITTPRPSDTPPKINFFGSQTTSIVWRGDANAVYYNVELTIRYREEDGSGTVLSRDTLTWTVARNIKRGDKIVNTQQGPFHETTLMVPGQSFYQFLADNIPPANGRFRYFDRLDVTTVGGGKEIEQFLLTASANSGLTGAEVIPQYTNLSEGFGIFTAKNVSTLGQVLIETKTVDSMSVHPLTFPLNFRF